MHALRSLPFVALAAALIAAPVLADAPKATEIKKAFKSGDASAVKAMLGRLEGNLDKKSVAAVLKNSPKLKSLGVYDDLVACLATAKGDGLEALAKAYKREKKGEMRFLLVDALGKNEDAGAEETLKTAIAEDKDPPVRVLAVRRMGKRYTTTAVDALIEVLAELEGDEKQDRLVREINASLGNLTGQDLSVAQDWQNYWSSHKDAYTKPEDHEEGTTKTRGTVMDRMKKQRPAELKTLTRIGASDLLVIDGNDAVDKVLDALDLKYKKLKRDEYEKSEFDPDKQILLFECPGGKHVLTDNGIQKLREFVAKGGYAFCSDWDLGKTLTKAFPKVVTFLKETPRSEGATDVSIKPFPQTSQHPLMRDVFPLNTWEGGSFAWKLHERSHLVNDAKSAVTPLVSCPDLQKHGSTTVAFTFAYTAEGGGRPVTGSGAKKLKKPAGRVLFVSSHFKDEEGDGDGYALQQLLLNFILEKQEQRRLQRAK